MTVTVRSIPFLGLLALASIASAPAAAATGQEPGDAPYLVLVSIDGFRHDYPDRFPTPALDRIARDGVRARSLKPVWPTLTFPNHYSIATGLYPAEHGIVGNRFPDVDRRRWYSYRDRESVQDGRWYGGEPIWVAAERAGLGSAAYFFVGTEAPVNGISPGEWRAFDNTVPGEERVRQALAWLALPAGERPHVVTLYFEHVDVASHRFGPGSPQSVDAIRRVDGWLGALLDGIDSLPVADDTYVVVVSDHGQLATRVEQDPLVLADLVDLEGIDVVAHGALAMLFFDEPDPVRANRIRDAVNDRWQHGRAWPRDEAPACWRVAGSPRVADVLIQADPGHVVIPRRGAAKATAGDHGWSPSASGMHGIFFAAGPRLPAGKRIDTVEAVDVYPLMLAILGLPDRRPVRRESPLPALLE